MSTDKTSLTVRTKAAVGTAMDRAGLPFTPVASAWKTRADARTEARSPEALNALMEANRGRRDAMRDVRRDRKAFENARSEVKWWNVVNGERRAARLVVKDSRALAREAGQVRKEAAKAYPMTLTGLAVRCHAAHAIPTAVWATFSDSLLSSTAFTGSVAAVAFNVAAVALGMRHVADTATDVALEALQPSQEERDLLQRLEPKAWHTVAEPRGLADVLSAGATLTESGIQAKLTLQGQMTLDKLTKMTEQLRAALRLKEGTRLELRPGKSGGHARLTLRTRSAADGVSLKGWAPGDPWGIDTVTGEAVRVPLGRRMLVAGTSGSGKSWSMRAVLAEASAYDDHCLIVIDAKQVEARCWEHRARVAVTRDEILDVTDELILEMHERLSLVPRGEDVIAISPTRRRITVFVDEGAEVIAMSKDAGQGEDKVEYSRILENLRTLARMARAAEIVILWASQKVTISGDGRGLDSQISAQITCRASLCVATPNESRVVFGDDAVDKGWAAHELPMPGYALLRDSNTAQPHIIKTRAMSPKDVIALPDRPIWSRRASSTGATVADVAARKAFETTTDPWAAPVTPTVILGSDIEAVDSTPTKVKSADRDDQLLEALRDDPCTTMAELARYVGVHKQTVKRSLERLEADGLVVKDDQGCWSVVG